EGMIVEEVVDNIHKLNKAEIEKRHQEKVYLESSDLLKRIQRVKTDHDRELGIRLKNPIDLEAGDILYMDDDNMIVIDVFTDDVLVLHPKSINEMGNIAHQLGNRHLPAQFEGDEMLVQYDYLVEELLKQQGVSYTREERKMQEAFRHIGHSHD